MKSGKSEFIHRVLGIALGVPPFIILLLLSRWTFIGMFIFLSYLSFREYWRMVGKEPFAFALWFSFYPLVLVYCSFVFSPFLQMLGWYIFFLVLIIWSLFPPSQVLERSGTYLWGCVYCFVFPFFWVKVGIEYSRWLLLFFVLLVWINDIFAYLIGVRWGQHKVAPTLSPQKSWEGLGGGVLATVLFSMLLGFLWFGIPPWMGSIAGCSVALLAFVGDLFESALKRKAGVKDSGKFLPGHGGILDRFDSFFVVGPLVYFLSWIIWKG
ncbi:MAG: phosphatidate cytidylyltransferase [Atribacterota bacterium]